ncbi:glycosyl transferases group 1 family protein [Lyngbya aestuarii BL J]|uniref:Glycosyl transferases group 1 family protein n=1 Tax=Lyngbya aestuarii BL J TaxID=1348334 RepID=U7QJB9_9CYAN|nr:glycosyltransferase [Lyngbya aestuarii]ERT07973.1 glycosyl transferases group 1 family protein [Lyngbya aestuarii BL J]
MKIAYLVNQYPKVSHSFIRREILAVEATGIEVQRFSVRSLESQLVDEADKQEFTKTRFILKVGAIGLFLSVLWGIVTRPFRFFSALRLAFQVGQKSERGILYHLIYLAEACVMLRWVLESQVEHIHVHFGTNSTTVAMFCHALGGPTYSFTVHGPEEFDQPQAINLTEKINRASFVVAISSFGKSQLYRWCDYKQWSKIQVVRCGVDNLFLEQPHVPIPDEPRLVCIGRLSEQKGHLVLLEAVSQLAAQGIQFKLVFVGDGPFRQRMETLIAQLNLKDYIEITGWATNTQVREQILAAQALVLPSFAEGLPVVLMEALALGRPALTTYIAGIPELVEPNKSGWLVPSGSTEALTAGLKTVLQTPREQLEEMGQSGAEQVANQHNITTEANKLAELFRQVCQK